MKKITQRHQLVHWFNFLFLFSASIINSTSAQNIFQKSIGGVGDQIPHALQITSGGGFIIAGTSSGLNNESEDIFLIKTDENGDTTWVRRFGGAGIDEAYSVIQSFDGGFVIAGLTNSFGAGSFDALILKTDSSGNLLWSKTIGGINSDAAIGIEQTAGGNYLIGGSYLIKLDGDGNLLWAKTYQGTSVYPMTYMCQTVDGDYLLVGPGDTNLEDGYDFFEAKVDSNGEVIWFKTMGTENRDYVFFVGPTNDGGSVIGIHNESIAFGPYDILMIRTDSNGDTLWTKIYGGPDFDGVYSIKELSSGGYATAGGTYSFDVGGTSDAYLIRSDNHGNVVWSKTYGKANASEYGLSMQVASDAGYAIVGSRVDIGNGATEMHLIKTDSSGQSGCDEKDVTTVVTHRTLAVTNASVTISSGAIAGSPALSLGAGATVTTLCSTGGTEGISEPGNPLSIFPNPATDKLFINSNLLSGKCGVAIYDLVGQRIFYEIFDLTPNIEINLKNFHSGIYCIELSDGDQIFKSKFVVSKD